MASIRSRIGANMEDRYLFKAKRLDNGEWVQGNLVWSDDTDDDYKAVIIPTTNSNMFTRGGARGDLGFENWCRVDPSTLCQCTGLKDKNGKLIWENDIVEKEFYTDYDAFANSERYVGTIKWTDCAAWEVVTDRCNILIAHELEFTDWKDHCKVIGNIFDNKELLESEE